MTADSLRVWLALLLAVFCLPLAAAPTVLITGSNASHGLAFAEEYAALGWRVIATCRTPAEADRLNALAADNPGILVEELDITDEAELEALQRKYAGEPIDVLMLNAAINSFRFGPTRFGRMDYDWFRQMLDVNVVAQLQVAEAFQDNVAASEQKKIIAMTSTGGSIAETEIPIAPAYRASKAALNMLMHTYAQAMERKGIIVGIVAPGTVDTEDYMNAEDPESVPSNYRNMMRLNRLAPRTAIDDMIVLIDGMSLEDSGVYYEWTGRVIPW